MQIQSHVFIVKTVLRGNDKKKNDLLNYVIVEGVAGTPWYFVNGVDLGVPPTSSNLITFEKWREFLDPMLENVTK